MENFYKVYLKSSEYMQEIENESVKVIITSPPYWDLKNYYHPEQIGFKEEYDIYLERLLNVFRECYRVLRKDGNLYININYRRKNGKLIRIHDDLIKKLVREGFYFQRKIIWNKPSGIPSQKFFTDRYEYILFFTKRPNYSLNEIYAFNDYKCDIEKDKYDVWRIVKKAGSIGKKIPHPAIFPVELAERAILLSSKKNDIVLDPFLGSGTTLIASAINGRNFLGYEINKSFKELILSRIEKEFSFIKNKVEFIY